jgi:hypothetical protein
VNFEKSNYLELKNSQYVLFDNTRTEEILEDLKIEPVDKKLRYKCKWLQTCNKNEQEGAKNNAE